jgi:ATP-binding cassette, subfamily B, bacterial PglK
MSFIFKTLRLLNKKEKLKGLSIMFMVIIGAVLETVGVGLILPYISIIQEQNLIRDNKILKTIYDFLMMDSEKQFLIWFGIGLFIFYLIKNILLVFFQTTQFKFIYYIQNKLAARLLKSYMYRPYSFHIQHNTAELLRNVNNEVLNYCHLFLAPAIIFISEVAVTTSILLFLIYLNPIPTLISILLITILAVSFLYIYKDKLSKAGKDQQDYNEVMIKAVNEGLGGIKETKILGHENFYVNTYSKNLVDYSLSLYTLRVVQLLPRYAMETIAVCSMLLVLIILIMQNAVLGNMLPALALIAMAAFRILPSFNRMLGSIASLRYFKVSLDVIYKDLILAEADIKDINRPKIERAQDLKALSGDIKLKNIVYNYPNVKEPTINNISLSISRGSCVGIVGPSGAGKTTLVDIILGLLVPNKGTVTVNGNNIFSDVLPQWQQNLGYIAQLAYHSDESIRRNVAFGIEDKDIVDEKVWEALAKAQLKNFVEELPDKLESYMGERGVKFSGGERQRIGIARALYHDPEVLLFDEPTSSLDQQTEKEIIKVIEAQKNKKTVIIIAHRISTLKTCDVIYNIIPGIGVKKVTFDEIEQGLNHSFTN